MKVLVLDLEDDILDLLDYNFTKAGFEVLGLSEEDEAVRTAVKFQPELVVVGNCSSPQRQDDICKQIRDLDRLWHRPALITCLFTNLELKENSGLFDAADLCVLTPIKPKELIALVKQELMLQPA